MNTKPHSCLWWKLASALWLMTISAAPAQPGVPLWTNRYDGPGNLNDSAYAMTVDANGNVIVAGYTDDAITGADFLIIKYSGAGVPLWTNRYDGPTNRQDYATGIAVDGNGNVFVTGNSFGSGGGDYATVAYSDAGVPLWTNRYNGPGDHEDVARAVAVDSGGNVFVTGYSYGDYLTIKYSGAGVPLWTNRYNGPENSADYAHAVAVDGSGNVFVTGSSYGSGSSYDYETIGYSGAGVPLWTNRYNGPGNDGDEAYALVVDGSGNVLVTGISAGRKGYPYNYGYATIKYSGAGEPLWTNRYSGLVNSSDYARAIAADGSGNVLVTGYSSNGTNWDYATVAYSGAGVPLWTNCYNGPGNNTDSARAVAVDGSGNVLVTGESFGSGTGDDYTTIKYSNAGVPLWTNRYDGPPNSEDRAHALAVDGGGNVFVTGESWNGSSYDCTTIKYSGASLLPIPLNYQTVGNQLVLSWTNATFSLQSAPAIQVAYTNIPGATSPYTNVFSDAQLYFRLQAN